LVASFWRALLQRLHPHGSFSQTIWILISMLPISQNIMTSYRTSHAQWKQTQTSIWFCLVTLHFILDVWVIFLMCKMFLKKARNLAETNELFKSIGLGDVTRWPNDVTKMTWIRNKCKLITTTQCGFTEDTNSRSYDENSLLFDLFLYRHYTFNYSHSSFYATSLARHSLTFFSSWSEASWTSLNVIIVVSRKWTVPYLSVFP